VNRLVEKRDVTHLAILLLIASCIGTYLIAATVVIAEDGVFYIEQAKKLPDNPMIVIRGHRPFGYPFLILIAHRLASLFGENSSVYRWIYSAQTVSLVCRLLSLIPLYFIGKLLVGGKRSFWAILILIMLPYPASFGSDVLRDWPHVLFLAWGFLFLLWAAERSIWWMFGVAGLTAGLGHMIRPECAQLIIYGVLWLLVRLLLPKRDMNRRSLLLALLTLLAGYAAVFGPYVKARGRVLPMQLEQLIRSSGMPEHEVIRKRTVDIHSPACANAGLPGTTAKAMGRLIRGLSSNLAHFFLPVLLVGIYPHFFKKSASKEVERFFMPAFTSVNIAMMLLLYWNCGYISRRHCLPLVVFSIFYVPVGLQFIADRLANLLFRADIQTHKPEHKRGPCFFALLLLGVAVCTPKLLKPIRADKKGYITAAEWIKNNTLKKDCIATPDRRISFYAERRGLVYGKKIPRQARYIVTVTEGEDEGGDFGRAVREEFSVWADNRKPGGKKLVIYRILRRRAKRR
jgi:4-amino-4-deoxy-L-arabinose transferase-like glycosyltransferase